MKLRKSLVSVLALGSIFVSAQTSFASEVQGNNVEKAISTSLDLTENNPNTVVSEVLTFDELAKQISEDNGISQFEAANQIMKSYNSNKSRSAESVSPLAATFRTIGQTISVKSNYNPTVNFYCETSEGGGYWGIVKILNISIDRADPVTGKSYKFGGTIFANLETAAKIHYIVEGDWYLTATISRNTGVNIPVGASGGVSFSLSSTSDWFAYAYRVGDIITQR
ncbi:hypothetical protein [Bacillus sp. EAC]|uniref:hypothetical protein n=1 Tax=Bacillus sp. EAC TaxID=1978338 RepID=UPI000B433368|nr:hypothetical protein [Bacillus sp. EAC]